MSATKVNPCLVPVPIYPEMRPNILVKCITHDRVVSQVTWHTPSGDRSVEMVHYIDDMYYDLNRVDWRLDKIGLSLLAAYALGCEILAGKRFQERGNTDQERLFNMFDISGNVLFDAKPVCISGGCCSVPEYDESCHLVLSMIGTDEYAGKLLAEITLAGPGKKPLVMPMGRDLGARLKRELQLNEAQFQQLRADAKRKK